MVPSVRRRPEEHARSRVCFACSWQQGGVPAAPGFKLLADSRYQAVSDLGRAHDARIAYLIFIRRGWAPPAHGQLLKSFNPGWYLGQWRKKLGASARAGGVRSGWPWPAEASLRPAYHWC